MNKVAQYTLGDIMSIASEISRLQTAKSDIKTSIENKGVEVDNSATIDEYAEYIGQLSSGDVANGVIEEYLASTGVIPVNSFVELGVEAVSVKNISTQSGANRAYIAKVKDNLYAASVTIASTNYIKTYTVVNDEIVELSSVAAKQSGYYTVDIVRLSTGRVVALFTSGWAEICSVADDGAITLDGGFYCMPDSSLIKNRKITPLSDEKFLGAYYNNGYMLVTVCDCATLTTGTTVQINTTRYYGNNALGVAATADGKSALIGYDTYSSTSGGIILSRKLTIDGDTISAVTTSDTRIAIAAAYNGHVFPIQIWTRDDEVFIATSGIGYQPAGSNYNLVTITKVDISSDDPVALLGTQTVQLNSDFQVFLTDPVGIIPTSAFGASLSLALGKYVATLASGTAVHGLTKTEATTTTPGEVWVLG